MPNPNTFYKVLFGFFSFYCFHVGLNFIYAKKKSNRKAILTTAINGTTQTDQTNQLTNKSQQTNLIDRKNDTNNSNSKMAKDSRSNVKGGVRAMPFDSNNNTSQWTEPLEMSTFASKTLNPVRKLMEQMKLEPNPHKQVIALSIGDPTVLSDLQKPECFEIAIKNLINSKANDGYTPSFGTEKARAAIAKYCSRLPNLAYTSNDVILSHGCSHALDLCICCLANRGQNILIPRPGFSIYKTLANTFDIEVKYYNLMPDKEWMIDLDHLASQIDENTVAIVVCNPSNPCGSVYSKQHLNNIIALAEAYCLPIIADEVYGDMVFPGNEFFYLSELSQTVPIFSCNALSKRFILPGWRFGWICIHDPKNLCKNIRQALMDLSTRILGPNSVVQAMVSDVLEKAPSSYYDNTMVIIQRNAEIVFEALSQLPGIEPKRPQGAMYMMFGVKFEHFPSIKDDTDFVQQLMQEQSVFCMPASCFSWPNYIRIVLTMRVDKITEACERISEFVNSHYVKSIKQQA